MKKFTYLLIAIMVIALALIISGCQDTRPIHKVEFPEINEESGYKIDVTGQFSNTDEFTYEIREGENFSFTISTLEGYTFKNIEVKDNGKELDYKTEHLETEERYIFDLGEIKKSYKITIAGIEVKKFKVTLNTPKYVVNDSDTEGVLYTDYSADTIKVKYNNQIFDSLTEAQNYINNANIELNYGDSFEIWIGENFAKYYSLFPDICIANNDFDGILYKKESDEYNSIGDVAFTYLTPETTNGLYVYENNMYKYKIDKVDKDLNLYFDTVLLQKEYYSINYTNSKVCQIQTPPTIQAGESWTLTINTKHEQAVDYNDVDYTNMKVYINGVEITQDCYWVGDDLKYDATRPTPSAYNENILTEYIITIDGIILPEDLTKIKAQPNENINYISFSRSFYYEDDYYYYEKKKSSFPVEMSFEKDSAYDYSEMIIKVNGDTYEYREENNRFIVEITPEQNEYDIEITGIVKK
ncbi:MAG: hypothetical protein GX242_00160 [Clostridiales bacterium]|nr:hypothetical protein [Clostridiales bacterium]